MASRSRSSTFLNGFRFDKDLWDPSHRFETSWLLPPWLLFAFRALFAVFALTTRFFIVGWTCTREEYGGCDDVVDSFGYFTVLTFWGLAFYFFFASLHTATYALRGRPLLESWPRPLQALHALYYTTIVTYPFLVTIVYWSLLAPSGGFATVFASFSSNAQHSANAALALFEIVIPRTSHSQMRPVHMLWLVVLLALYLALAYLMQATRGFYPYSFLDPNENGRGLVAAYVMGIAAGSIIIFGIIKGLVWVRQWLTERVLGMDGKFADRPSRSRGDYDQAEMGTIGRK